MRCPVQLRFFLIRRSFHRWQPCPFKYVLVCHFVHPGYPHDRTQMLRFRIGGWTARLDGISSL
ncbi:hypothetical protein NP493_315g03005 [Ridgeia piscesae]|uniref:Uncharacterized protein n=1 Tax=Ridgeia piscesae TaxID=27915 RepID=A0AAD9NUJ4_RIDPI|nr:hypothetical protein NP493_315g03005 [Ridgeia piscesae]